MEKRYYGRRFLDTGGEERYEPLISHLKSASKRARHFADEFGFDSAGEAAGLLHDIGKYQWDFQRRLRGENIRVDHSTAGAWQAFQMAEHTKNAMYQLIGYAIAGHHAGLPDYGSKAGGDSTLRQRLKRCNPDAFSHWDQEVGELPELPDIMQGLTFQRGLEGFSLAMLTRFLFSCVVDADRLDAEAAERGTEREAPAGSLEQMLATLEQHMAAFGDPERPLNRKRALIAQRCQEAAQGERGLYSLSVPTGGGKTLSSLLFALRHARRHGLNRIVYAIPFTSIIEQNAAVYADIFGRENILEHHSNFENPFETSEDERGKRLRQAAENWDRPLIVTTNVQLFESLFTNKPSRARRLHRLAGSVIILDEAQALPNAYLRPCMAALEELCRNYGCTVVFCTATQPEFDRNEVFPLEVNITEVVPEWEELAASMRRTRCSFIGRQEVDALASQLRAHHQVLCIVNTKRHAGDLYDRLADMEGTYHLSTHMTPEHRKQTLVQIRRRLAEDKPCRVVSTQLIEAGVDIDFPIVYRALAGIDSITQAAGRCNREGKLPELGEVRVFEPEDRYLGQGFLALTAGIGKSIINRHADFLSSAAVREYFEQLFDVQAKELDEAEVLRTCREAIKRTGFEYPFATIAQNFKFIQDAGTAVVIPRDQKALDLLEQLPYVQRPGAILRKLAPYCVNVHDNHLNELMTHGVVQLAHEMVYVLEDLQYYSDHRGLLHPSVMEQDYIV